MSIFLQAVIAILLGLLSGIITGITPGLHVNLVSVIVISLSPLLLTITTPLILGVYIITLAITHTFCDALPSVYLGCPDESKALGALPGHRLLRQGKGHLAIMLLTFGSLASLILGFILFPLFMLSMVKLQPLISAWIGYALIIIVGLLILRENRRWIFALCLFLLSGFLGLLVFSLNYLSQPLFSLLSGLFGASLLLESLSEKSTLPAQSASSTICLSRSTATKAVTASTGMGFVAAFLPGFGSSQAAIVATKFVGDIGDDGFLVLLGGINTTNVLLSIVAIHAISKARNGAIVAINSLLGQIGLTEMVLYLAVSLIAGSLAAIITLRLSQRFANIIPKINYHKLAIAIIISIAILSFIFDGFTGLLILFVATALGLLASSWHIGKSHLLGCLLLPVILYFTL